MKNFLSFDWNRKTANDSLTITLSLYLYLCLALCVCTTSCSSPPTQRTMQLEQGERSYQTGVAALEMWRYDVALSQFMESLRWSQSVENPEGILRALHAIAATFEAKGDLDSAIESSSAAVRFGLQDAELHSLPNRETWSPLWIESYWVRATLKAQSKQLEQAQQDLSTYISLLSPEKLRGSAFCKINNLKAFIAIQEQNWETAENLAWSVLEKQKSATTTIDSATALQRLAEANEGRGELSDSITFWEKSLDANRSLGRSERMVLALEGLARVHSALNHPEPSAIYAERAQTLKSALASSN